MTTNEIKTLIEKTIAGQGSQVDIGGKLAEILGAIVDAIPPSPSGETPRPIVLTSAPETDDTLETLAEKGLTLDEIQAAAQGLRNGVVIEKTFYPIAGCLFDSEESFLISFYAVYRGAGADVTTCVGYSIENATRLDIVITDL